MEPKPPPPPRPPAGKPPGPPGPPSPPEPLPPGVAEAFSRLKPEEAGDRIGAYKLLEEIGEGGFGTVWIAEQQEPVRRRVAMKIIKLGMDTKEVVARFEQERQALAMMDHPNIAKVFDAGATQWGRPFFVMELVRGIPITTYCDQNRLSTVGRLELFASVCHAVQHAHQKGIIHRDIKPSNVLVAEQDGVPVTKVIDFGIAKATHGRLTNKTIYTELMQMIGTPPYMSPEQAEMNALDVDTRTDIYSLGVLLYELLVGRTPFDRETLMKAGLDEIRRVIREEEPPKPSTAMQTMPAEQRTTVASRRQADPARITRLLRGDLDWVVMKALEKDRTRRYETAVGFADDIRRYLTNEPVSAAAPGKFYRLRKFARRNRVTFAAGSAVAMTLIGGIAASSWQAVRATRAEAQARKQEAAEAEARKDAEAVTNFFTTIFESPNPARDGRTITVAETLDRAAAQLDTEFANQPERRTTLLGVLADTYRALGLPNAAIPLHEKAQNERVARFGPEHPATLIAIHKLAMSYEDAGRFDEAIRLNEQVLEIRRKALGSDHTDTLGVMNNLANCYSDAGRWKEALRLNEQILEVRRRNVGPEHPDTLMSMNNLANSYKAAGRSLEALNLHEQTFELRRRIFGPKHPETILSMGNLANSYARVGRVDEALQLREKVLELSRTVLGPEHPDTLDAMNNLANSYDDADRHDEAIRLHERVVELRRKVLGDNHPDTIRALFSLAHDYLGSARYEEALPLAERSLELSRKILGPDHPTTLKAMNNLALSHRGVGRQSEALRLQEQILELRSRILPPDDRDTLGSMTNLAVSYREAGRLREATDLQERSLATKRRVLPETDPFMIAAIKNLAYCYEAAGRAGEAEALRKELAAIKAKAANRKAIK
jgi:serine/threonine protein kinase